MARASLQLIILILTKTVFVDFNLTVIPMGKIHNLLQLLEKGYMLYTGAVPQDFYQKRYCPHPEKAEWLAKTVSMHNITSSYICLGCERMCSEQNPEGWQHLLPIAHHPTQTAFVAAWPTSAEEMLKSKLVLRVDEASWVLNVSARTIYRMLEEGKLQTVVGTPTRVTAESVRACLMPIDYIDDASPREKDKLSHAAVASG